VLCACTLAGSVFIENCEGSTFFVSDKVSAITLVGCARVTVKFSTVVSKVELIRCQDCEVVCGVVCSSYTLDECKGCRVSFPKKAPDAVQFITTRSPGTQVTARCEDSAEGKDSVKFDIVEKDTTAAATAAAAADSSDSSAAPDAAGAGGAGAGAGAGAGSAAIPQFRTRWVSGAFSTVPVVREGPLGYFSN
jgi:hypothetical protein